MEYLEWIGLSPIISIYAILCIFVSAVIRGYSGFGFSALTVSSLSFVLPPIEIIPLVFLLEIAASINMLPMVWKEVNWKILKWLILGNVVGTPFGIFLLVNIDQEIIRFTISILVFFSCILLLRQFKFSSNLGKSWTLCVGSFSGLVNGSTGVGGLPIAIFFLSASGGASLTRASLVAYLFFSDIFASLISGTQHIMSLELFSRTLIFLIPMTIGIYIGHKKFVKTTQESFRKFVLIFLVILSLAGILRSILSY
tara:strand:+ start:2485 stop:3246 length:762 start_codon:yes stop_codon:yes gene_type:complete